VEQGHDATPSLEVLAKGGMRFPGPAALRVLLRATPRSPGWRELGGDIRDDVVNGRLRTDIDALGGFVYRPSSVATPCQRAEPWESSAPAPRDQPSPSSSARVAPNGHQVTLLSPDVMSAPVRVVILPGMQDHVNHCMTSRDPDVIHAGSGVGECRRSYSHLSICLAPASRRWNVAR